MVKKFMYSKNNRGVRVTGNKGFFIVEEIEDNMVWNLEKFSDWNSVASYIKTMMI